MKKSILSLLLCVFLSSLHAVETFPLYVGAGAGLARYVGDDVTDPIYLPGQKVEGDRAYQEAYIGIELGKVFAVEVAYAQFGEIEEKFTLNPDLNFVLAPNDTEEVNINRISIMGVAEYPLTLGFSVYATGGYAYYDFQRLFYSAISPVQNDFVQDLSKGDHGLEYGFGAKWEALSRISIVGQWSQSVIGDRNVQSNRLSVQFHF